MIDPYLQQFMIMEIGGTCMVPMLKAQKMEGQIQLTAMKLERVDVNITSAATIACSEEDNDV